MTKILNVINPFFTAELGDKFEFDEKKNVYSLEKNEEFYKIAGDSASDVKSTYSAKFEISVDYAASLIEDGYLEEYVEKTYKDRQFVNIFDEIDRLVNNYTEELNNVDKDFKNEPQCLKVEKMTVLGNLIKVLNHLKNLKK